LPVTLPLSLSVSLSQYVQCAECVCVCVCVSLSLSLSLFLLSQGVPGSVCVYFLTVGTSVLCFSQSSCTLESVVFTNFTPNRTNFFLSFLLSLQVILVGGNTQVIYLFIN